VVVLRVHLQAEEPNEPHRQARLFFHLSNGPRGWVLPGVEKAARNIPTALARINRTPAQQYQPVLDYQRPSTGLCIPIVSSATDGAALRDHPPPVFVGSRELLSTGRAKLKQRQRI